MGSVWNSFGFRLLPDPIGSSSRLRISQLLRLRGLGLLCIAACGVAAIGEQGLMSPPLAHRPSRTVVLGLKRRELRVLGTGNAGYRA